MSGVIYNGEYMENVDYVHIPCSHYVYEGNAGYYCVKCGKTVADEELNEGPDTMPKVMIARNVNGISINGAVEFLLDEHGDRRLFDNQAIAEGFLLLNGIPMDELDSYYYLEPIESVYDKEEDEKHD